MSRLTSAKVLDWLLPTMLAAVLGVLGWMGQNIADMSKSLAVAVTKIDDHERRIGDLEGEVFHRRSR